MIKLALVSVSVFALVINAQINCSAPSLNACQAFCTHMNRQESSCKSGNCSYWGDGEYGHACDQQSTGMCQKMSIFQSQTPDVLVRACRCGWKKVEYCMGD